MAGRGCRLEMDFGGRCWQTRDGWLGDGEGRASATGGGIHTSTQEGREKGNEG